MNERTKDRWSFAQKINQAPTKQPAQRSACATSPLLPVRRRYFYGYLLTTGTSRITAYFYSVSHWLV